MDATVAETLAAITALCGRSEYLADIVANNRRWSGSDLTGNAKKWGSKYAAQRNKLERDIRARFDGVRWVGGTSSTGAKRMVVPCLDGDLVIGAA